MAKKKPNKTKPNKPKPPKEGKDTAVYGSMAPVDLAEPTDYKEASTMSQADWNAMQQAEKDMTSVGEKPTSMYNVSPIGRDYVGKYDANIDAYLNKLMSREDFNYDPLQDASYRALAKVYNARGNRAARDTMGDAANLNGGYGSSYSTLAAAQARNVYNQEFAALVPELEANAYDRYRGNYEMDLSTLGALQDVDDTMYGRYRDKISDYQWQSGFDYQKERDAVADQHWNKEYKLDKKQSKLDRKLTRAKIRYTRRQANALKNKSSGSKGGGGHRSSGGSRGGSYYYSSGGSSSSGSGSMDAGAVADMMKNIGAWAGGQAARLVPPGTRK